MEHSDENIKFWMACETYKKIASRWSRTSRAKKLYKIYIQPESPREVTASQGWERKAIPPEWVLGSVSHTHAPALPSGISTNALESVLLTALADETPGTLRSHFNFFSVTQQ